MSDAQRALVSRRRRVGLEQRLVAQLVGLRNDELCRIERLQRSATPEQLRQIDSVLRCFEGALEAARKAA